MQRMGAAPGASTVIADGGRGINGARLRAGPVDEVHVITFPALVGGLITPSFVDGAPFPPGNSPADSAQWALSKEPWGASGPDTKCSNRSRERVALPGAASPRHGRQNPRCRQCRTGSRPLIGYLSVSSGARGPARHDHFAHRSASARRPTPTPQAGRFGVAAIAYPGSTPDPPPLSEPSPAAISRA